MPRLSLGKDLQTRFEYLSRVTFAFYELFKYKMFAKHDLEEADGTSANKKSKRASRASNVCSTYLEENTGISAMGRTKCAPCVKRRKTTSTRGYRNKRGAKTARQAATRKSKHVPLMRVPVLTTRNCPRCNVKPFFSDPDSTCCGKTLKIEEKLIDLPKVPTAWLALFTDALFSQRCRQYNNYFAFSAIAATHGTDRVPGGPSNLILHGKSYHRILPGPCQTGPLRFFLYDGLYEENEKSKLNEEWIATLQHESVRLSPFWNKLQQLSKETARYARLEITVTEARETAALVVLDPNQPVKTKSIV